MAHVVADRVKETTTTTSTSNLTLTGAVTGFQAFSAVCANNDYVYYVIAHNTLAEWEVGLGQWQTGGTLVRADANVLRGSSGAGARVNFSAGTKTVFISNPTQDRFILPQLTADPTAPTSGVLMYSRSIAGRSIPRFIGPSGLDSAVQPSLWANSIALWSPGASSTAAVAIGTTWTVSATQAHPIIADTNVMTRLRRATYTTTTTAGNTSGARSIQAVCDRNMGFFFAARFGILTYSASMQVIVGLNAGSGALGGEPSAVNDSVYMGKDSGESVWQVATRDTSATSKTSTGRNTAAAGAADVYDFYAFCKPGDSKITVRVIDVATPAVLVDNVEKSSSLPTGATVMYAHAECRNSSGGAGTAVAMFLGKIYIETDI